MQMRAFFLKILVELVVKGKPSTVIWARGYILSAMNTIVFRYPLFRLRLHHCNQYLMFCEEENFQLLSHSTLFEILEVREASQGKSLQGLDNTAADGASGCQTLENIVEELEKVGVSSSLWIL